MEDFGKPLIGHISNLLACRLRFESLAGSDRLCAFGEITTAAEHCHDIKCFLILIFNIDGTG